MTITLARRIQHYHRVQVPSLNIPNYFRMNFDKFVDGKLRFKSCARRKRTSINMCFESYNPTVEYHEYGSQDSNNVETKVKHSSMHKAGKSRPPRKQQRRQWQQQQHSFINASENEVHLYPSRGQNLGLQILDNRRAEDTPLIVSSSSAYGSTPR